MRFAVLTALLALLVGLTGCTVCCSVSDCCCDPCAARTLRVDAPPAVHAAVQKALPGFVVTAFEIEEEDGKRVYDFDGRAGGKRYEIEVDAAGNVLEVEEQKEEEEEDDDDEEGHEDDEDEEGHED